MKLPAHLRTATHTDVEAFSVFTQDAAIADHAVKRVLYRYPKNRTIPNCGEVLLRGKRIYWCLRCMVASDEIYQPAELATAS